MREKIRIVHYCNQLSVGGTERTMEIFCKYLDRSRYEIYAVARRHNPNYLKRLKIELGALLGIPAAKGKKRLWSSMNLRQQNFCSLLGKDHVIIAKNSNELRKTILALSPDILHVHYSGNPEPPTSDEHIMSQVPVTVTTNPFEKQNTAPSHRYVKKILFVSNWLLKNKAKWALEDPRAAVLYNPIEVPCSSSDLRARLNIPSNAFVVGRIGRSDPGIHDPIALKAYRKIETDNTYFLAISPPENMIRQAETLQLRNFISLPASTENNLISQFYNTIDVLAHARRDGETFGCGIAEAMMHGKPVISHISSFMNAQEEVIGDAGFICPQDDWMTYSQKLESLRDNPELRAGLAAKSKKRAFETFEARKITKKLESIYEELLAKASKKN